MADYLVTDTELTSIANAIRTKGGTSANLSFPTEFVSAINNIPTGSITGLEYEIGAYEPSSDTVKPKIYFTNSHSSRPAIIIIAEDPTNVTTHEANKDRIFCSLINYQLLFNHVMYYSNSSTYVGEIEDCYYNGSNAGSSSKTRWWDESRFESYVDPSWFMPYVYSNKYYRAGRTYNWIAIWV